MGGSVFQLLLVLWVSYKGDLFQSYRGEGGEGVGADVFA